MNSIKENILAGMTFVFGLVVGVLVVLLVLYPVYSTVMDVQNLKTGVRNLWQAENNNRDALARTAANVDQVLKSGKR